MFHPPVLVIAKLVYSWLSTNESCLHVKATPQKTVKQAGTDSIPGLPGFDPPPRCPSPLPHLFPGSTEHGLLDVCVHAPEGIVPSRDALEVAQGPVLVPHHLLHHGRIPGKLHCLVKGERQDGPWNQRSI